MHVKDLRKQFGSVVAVRDVAFSVGEAQMIGIIGRSGAGKSTLLRMINRLTDASAGEIVVDGRDILQLRGREKREWQRHCAMIFQQFNLVPRLDVITNVMLGRVSRHSVLRSMFKMFSAEDIADGLASLERLGIADQALQRVETLSGGQQQRVAIARALMQAPGVILADEPIASLDPMSAEVVMNALRSIHDREGLTVICNLHTLDTARSYCSRVIGMREGEIVFDGPAEALTTRAAREIYGADEAFNEAVTSTAIRPAARAAQVGAAAFAHG